MIQRTWWPRINPNAQLAKGLVFAGLGGGASTLQYADASPYGNHGTLTNMDPPTDWVFDPTLGRWVLDFDGSNDYVTAQSPPSYPFALSCWVYIREVKSAGIVAIKSSSYEGIAQLSVGAIQVAWNKCAQSVLGLNTWLHIAVNYASSSAISCLINGINISLTNVGSNSTNNGPSIGAAVASKKFLNGLMADAMTWNRVLSPVEIQQLADPSNTLLSGLILPPRRMVFPAAVVGGAYSLDCDSGSFTLAGQDVTLTTARILDAASGEFTLTGQDVGLNRGYTLSAESGSLTLTGQDVALTATRTIGADVGEFTLSGQDAALLAGRAVSADSGEFTLAGQDVTLTADRTLSAASGEFTLAGQDVTLTYTPVGEYSLTADSGSFTLAGQDVGLTADRTLSADTSEFTLSGQDVALQSGRVLGADVGEFALAGQDATLAAARTLSADSGTFTLTGQDVGLAHGYVLSAESGDYTLTGQDVTLSRTWALVVESAEYVLTGQAVTLTYSGVNQDGVLWTPAARSRVWTPAARSRVWTPSG